MDLNKNFIKRKIELKKNFSDEKNDGYYLNVFLEKTCELFEYVDIKKDEKIFKIDKQKINPYYIDFGFFNSINRIKINNENDLTPIMKNYLNQNYSKSIMKYSALESPVDSWFSEIGYNILLKNIIITVDENTGEEKRENELEKLEKLELNTNSITSKSFFFPISINK